MLFLLSPAKSLDYDTPLPADLPHTLPQFVPDSKALIEVLRQKSPQDVASLMSISDTLAGLNLSTWFGLFASAGVSPALAQRWTNGFAATLKQKEVQRYLDGLGVQRENLQLEDFARFVRSEHAKYGQLLQSSGMRLASN